MNNTHILYSLKVKSPNTLQPLFNDLNFFSFTFNVTDPKLITSVLNILHLRFSQFSDQMQ
jgi:hypothetical protein